MEAGAPPTGAPVRILVTGATGMLGHKMWQTIGRRFPDTWCTLRGGADDVSLLRQVHPRTDRVLAGVDLADIRTAERLLEDHRFDVVVNCAGVIRQRPDATAAIPSIAINALLPHCLADTLGRWGGRLIHVSTDCVFSGLRGWYTEDDPSDAGDLYGRSKFLGEVAAANALTLRTSVIGRELRHHRSLLDWFLAQAGTTVQGYRRAWWSGVTTNHLADLVVDLIAEHPSLHGLYQVSSGRLSKLDLLLELRARYDLDIEIVPDDSVFCDRSLCGARLTARIGYACPSWDALLDQLVSDPTPYPSPAAGRGTTRR
jgi:dTDP-4-dehydrorhamnose reductase